VHINFNVARNTTTSLDIPVWTGSNDTFQYCKCSDLFIFWLSVRQLSLC